MLKGRESLAGKLLLSSALVAVSLAYGWWQRQAAERPVLAMAPMPEPTKPVTAAAPVMEAPPAAPQSQEATAAPSAKEAPPPAAGAQAQKTLPAAKAEARVEVTTAPPATPQAVTPPAPPAALTVQQTLQMNLPTDETSPAMAWVTGDPGSATPPLAQGLRLEDGDYVSDRHEFEWGDLRVRIRIHGGQIVAVQVLQFPDHRSQSLYLSQMALPTLQSEVIKSQKAQVDAVSSATDTSYAFQDVIANALIKATRE